MSRTFRKKEGKKHFDPIAKQAYCSDWRSISEWCPTIELYPLDYNSQEYQKESARYHSDAKTKGLNYNGPKWFRKRVVERPQRRQAKTELRKYMLNPDYEVCLTPKNHIPYWF
jgi:hypothetical protein